MLYKRLHFEPQVAFFLRRLDDLLAEVGTATALPTQLEATHLRPRHTRFKAGSTESAPSMATSSLGCVSSVASGMPQAKASS